MSEEYFEVYKCMGCVMLDFNCVIYSCITEMINQCPCHNCLVKITCPYDIVCDPHIKFMDNIMSCDEYAKRIEIYDKRYNSDAETS
jgi:hypothetical protein